MNKLHNGWGVLSKSWKYLLNLITVVLCLTSILTACSPSYPQVQQRFKPGMTYKDVVALLGKDGQPIEGRLMAPQPDEFQYQWYVDDYTRVLMRFTESLESAEFSNLILHSYQFESGYAHIHIGMTYRELVRKIGKPFREGDCFGEGSSFGGTMLWKLDDHLFLLATFKLPETVTDTEDLVFPYDYVVTHFYFSTVPYDIYE